MTLEMQEYAGYDIPWTDSIFLVISNQVGVRRVGIRLLIEHITGFERKLPPVLHTVRQ